MPVKINNLESDVKVMDGEPSEKLLESDIENIVRKVIERIKEVDRISEETKITNKVSKKELFD